MHTLQGLEPHESLSSIRHTKCCYMTSCAMSKWDLLGATIGDVDWVVGRLVVPMWADNCSHVGATMCSSDPASAPGPPPLIELALLAGPGQDNCAPIMK